MKFFIGFDSPETIKAEYRRLALLHHPDRNRDNEAAATEIMKLLNAEYLEALKRCDGYTSKNSDGKEYKYTYKAEREEKLVFMVDELLKIGMNDVDILIVGVWIWIDGKTKEYKEKLKELGCRWHAKRFMWYWREETNAAWRRNPNGFEDIAAKYGVEIAKKREENKTFAIAN